MLISLTFLTCNLIWTSFTMQQARIFHQALNSSTVTMFGPYISSFPQLLRDWLTTSDKPQSALLSALASQMFSTSPDLDWPTKTAAFIMVSNPPSSDFTQCCYYRINTARELQSIPGWGEPWQSPVHFPLEAGQPEQVASGASCWVWVFPGMETPQSPLPFVSLFDLPYTEDFLLLFFHNVSYPYFCLLPLLTAPLRAEFGSVFSTPSH